MENKTYLFLSIIAICLTTSCQSNLKSEDKGTESEEKTNQNQEKLQPTPQTIAQSDIYTKAAIETCKCMQPMVEKAKHLKELEVNKQIIDMKKVVIEMEQIQPQIQKCSDEIRMKYGKINKLNEAERIQNALIKECPDMANLFSNLSKAGQ